jgi:hypothetical protein
MCSPRSSSTGSTSRHRFRRRDPAAGLPPTSSSSASSTSRRRAAGDRRHGRRQPRSRGEAGAAALYRKIAAMERRDKIKPARTCTSRSCVRSRSTRRRARLDRAHSLDLYPFLELIEGGVEPMEQEPSTYPAHPVTAPGRRGAAPPESRVGRTPGSSTPRRRRCRPHAAARLLPEREGRVVLDVPRPSRSEGPIVARPTRSRLRQASRSAEGLWADLGADAAGALDVWARGVAIAPTTKPLTGRSASGSRSASTSVGDRRADPQRAGRLADRPVRGARDHPR